MGCFSQGCSEPPGCAGAPTFRQLIGRVKATAQSAMAHAAVPLACVVSEVRVPTSGAHAPVFQTAVQVAGAGGRDQALGMDAEPFMVQPWLIFSACAATPSLPDAFCTGLWKVGAAHGGLLTRCTWLVATGLALGYDG